MSINDWISLDPSVIVVVCTVVVAVCTMISVFLTKLLVSETRRLREAQTDPRVSVQVEPHDASLGYQLVIRNEGQGPAMNVRFEFKGDPTYFRNSWAGKAPPAVDQLPAIRDGLEYMGIGYTQEFFLNQSQGEMYISLR